MTKRNRGDAAKIIWSSGYDAKTLLEEFKQKMRSGLSLLPSLNESIAKKHVKVKQDLQTVSGLVNKTIGSLYGEGHQPEQVIDCLFVFLENNIIEDVDYVSQNNIAPASKSSGGELLAFIQSVNGSRPNIETVYKVFKAAKTYISSLDKSDASYGNIVQIIKQINSELHAASRNSTVNRAGELISLLRKTVIESMEANKEGTKKPIINQQSPEDYFKQEFPAGYGIAKSLEKSDKVRYGMVGDDALKEVPPTDTDSNKQTK
jgi:hypothetical protein